MAPEKLLEEPCTVLVPAALDRVITRENASKLNCTLVAEGANGPTTPDADHILKDRGILVIPDVLCNAGGVTVSYFEWVQDIQQLMWSEEQVNGKLQDLMLNAYRRVRTLATTKNLTMRTAALALGVQKVVAEMNRRGLFP
jgi:glutamate dehydrogenase (NAD(P)+)